MANPKTASQKYTQYQNDNFNVWVQKTNIVAREEGDLNNLSTNLLSELTSATTKTGTVSGNLGSYTITGFETTFLTDVAVGDTIKITINTTVIESRVVAVATNTSLTIESAIPVTFSGNAYENLKSLNLVSAINAVYDGESRRTLIKAIAMS
jgi:hypothetical protein